MDGSLSVDGSTINTTVTGTSTVAGGLTYYSLNLAHTYSQGYNGTVPVTLTGWQVNWGDGSTPDTYNVNNLTGTVIAAHYFSPDDTTPAIQITATTSATGNIAPLTLTLPVTFTNGTPPAPVDLQATEYLAGQVALNWNYDTNLATDFTVTATSIANNSSLVFSVPSGSLSYTATGLVPDQSYEFSVVANVPQPDTTIVPSGAATIAAAASAVNILATAPASVDEFSSNLQVTLSGGTGSDAITNWSVTWTDQDGVPFGTQPVTLNAATGTISLPQPQSTTVGLIAMVTATDAAGTSFDLPEVDVAVVPAAPTLTAAAATSPNAVQISWTNNSTRATYDDILVSTDGVNFSELYTLDASQTSYLAQGLTPGTAYTFEIAALDSNYDQSAPSNTLSATTLVDPWNISVSGSPTVTEGGSYQLNLSSGTIAGAPTLDRWTVDWGDGTVLDYPAGQPVTHTFAAGTSTSTVQVSASNADGSEIVQAPPIVVDVVPLAPSDLVATDYSATEVDLTWTSNSQSATGYDILSSVDGAAYTSIGSVDGNTVAYADTTVAANQTVQYKVQAVGATTQATSAAVTAPAVTTPSGVPTLTATENPTDSNSVNLTWTYKGNDDSGFELEMEDTTIGENFHTIATPGPVNASGTDSLGVSIHRDDTYKFRIRVDHTDGSVTDYVSTDFAENNTLTPTVTVLALGDGLPGDNSIEVDWTLPAGAAPDATVALNYRGTTTAGPGWAGLDTGDAGDGFAYTSHDGHGSAVFDMNDGQSAMFRASVNGLYNGTWGYSSEVQQLGSAGPSPNVTLTVQSDGGVRADYTDPLHPNPDPYNSYWPQYRTWFAVQSPASQLASAGRIFDWRVDGSSTKIPYSFTSSGPGDHVYVVVQETLADGEIGYAKKDVVVPGGKLPVAPGGLRATFDFDGAANHVHLVWNNLSNNESGFLISRAPGVTPNIRSWQSVGQTGADVTVFNDTPPGSGPWTYEVWAWNSAGASGGARTTITPQFVIVLLQGDNSGRSIVDAVHESVGAGYYKAGRIVVTDAWSFGEQDPDVSRFYGPKLTWLGWRDLTLPGYLHEGEIYQTDGFGTPIRTKVVTEAQEASWVAWMHLKREGTKDVYSVLNHNCTTYSEWEFDDAPGVH